MVVVQAAADAGVPLTRVLGSGHLGSAVGASETARAWVTVVIFAAILTVTTRLTVRWEWHAVMLIPAIVRVVAVPGHRQCRPGCRPRPCDEFGDCVRDRPRGADRAEGCRGDTAGCRRDAPPLQSGCGGRRCRGVALRPPAADPAGRFRSVQLRLRQTGLLAGAALLIGWIIDLRGHSSRALAVTSALSATVAVAATSAMAVHTAPRLLASRPTVWDVLLGYRLPGPPTIGQLLSFWRFDTFLGGLAIALGAAYVIGVIRLRRRGDAWPTGRLVAWLAGCAALLTATSSGVRAYGSAMFSIHMVEHMTLNMFAPVLLVLGHRPPWHCECCRPRDRRIPDRGNGSCASSIRPSRGSCRTR